MLHLLLELLLVMWSEAAPENICPQIPAAGPLPSPLPSPIQTAFKEVEAFLDTQLHGHGISCALTYRGDKIWEHNAGT
jgi:hypothetical protein